MKWNKTELVKIKQSLRSFRTMLKLDFTPNTKLTGRQRIKKLKTEDLLLNILLVIVILLTFLSGFAYYQIHRTVHFENITYTKSGLTSISCFNSFKDSITCCADNPYLITKLINLTETTGIYECYRFKR